MGKSKIIVTITILAIAIIVIIGIFMKAKNEENKIDVLDLLVDEYPTEETQIVEKEIIKVHISGEVNYNGVLELEEGDRIDDAIKKAGGLTEQANIKKVNLACKLEDGQKIYIPSKDEERLEEIDQYGGIVLEEEKQEKININTARQTDLEMLPGVGPSLALKIINYRNENGKFNSIEDIKNVKGMGESKYEEIKELIKVK